MKYAVQVAALMKTVLLHFLRLVILVFHYHFQEGQTEFLRQPSGKIRDQLRVISGWNAGNPLQYWYRLPSFQDHFSNGIHQLITKMSRMFIIGDGLRDAMDPRLR